jgi:hypothetical protein
MQTGLRTKRSAESKTGATPPFTKPPSVRWTVRPDPRSLPRGHEAGSTEATTRQLCCARRCDRPWSCRTDARCAKGKGIFGGRPPACRAAPECRLAKPGRSGPRTPRDDVLLRCRPCRASRDRAPGGRARAWRRPRRPPAIADGLDHLEVRLEERPFEREELLAVVGHQAPCPAQGSSGLARDRRQTPCPSRLARVTSVAASVSDQDDDRAPRMLPAEITGSAGKSRPPRGETASKRGRSNPSGPGVPHANSGGGCQGM